MSSTDTTYNELLSAILSQERPDLKQLQNLVTISDHYSQRDLEKLTVAARQEEWRDALRDAGFLASVADSLQADTDVEVALQAIRFLTNELAYSDESRLIMLQADRIARLAHWLQVQVTANTACLAFHNLFNTDQEEDDDDEEGENADRSVTYQTRCCAIAQGLLRTFCQITVQRARADDAIKWDDWATMCSYLLECAIDHKKDQAGEKPVLGSAQSLITGFEGFDLLAPPADGGCRCASPDEPIYRYVCDLIAACAGMIEHPRLVFVTLMEEIGDQYGAGPVDVPVETQRDNAMAAVDLFKTCLEYLRAHQKEFVRRAERILYLIDIHNHMISEIHAGYQSALDDMSDETDYFSADGLGMYSNNRGLLFDKLDNRLRSHRHQISDLIGECTQTLGITDKVSLRSHCVFQAAAFGIRGSSVHAAELCCLILGNLANNEKVARTMVVEHNIHLSLFKNFSGWPYKASQTHDFVFAMSGLLCNLAIPEHQTDLLQCAEGGEPQIYRAIEILLMQKNDMIRANGLRLIRLLCRSFEGVAWAVLGIAVGEDGIQGSPPRFKFDHVLAGKPSRAIQIEAARIVSEIYKHLRAVGKRGLEGELRAQETTHSLETPVMLGNMVNVCRMESNEATGIWLGLALIAQYSPESARAVYQALVPERKFFHRVATRSQEVAIAPAAPTHEQAAKHNAMVGQATSARNAYSLAKILSDQIGDDTGVDDSMDLRAWVQEQQRR